MQLSREHSHPNAGSRSHNHNCQLNLLHTIAREVVAPSVTPFSQAIECGRLRGFGESFELVICKPKAHLSSMKTTLTDEETAPKLLHTFSIR